MLLIGAGCWLVAALVIVLALAGLTAGVDRAAIDGLRPFAADHPIVTEAMRWATWAGDWQRRIPVAAAFFAYLVWRRFGRAASYILYTTLGIWALNAWALKPLFARARPDPAEALVAATSHSLPSGHAANAGAVFTAIALVASVIWWRKAQRRAIWTVAALAILLIGVSRVWLAVHWPSDVVAGWLVGIGWALLLAALLKPVKARAESSRR